MHNFNNFTIFTEFIKGEERRADTENVEWIFFHLWKRQFHIRGRIVQRTAKIEATVVVVWLVFVYSQQENNILYKLLIAPYHILRRSLAINPPNVLRHIILANKTSLFY